MIALCLSRVYQWTYHSSDTERATELVDDFLVKFDIEIGNIWLEKRNAICVGGAFLAGVFAGHGQRKGRERESGKRKHNMWYALRLQQRQPANLFFSCPYPGYKLVPEFHPFIPFLGYSFLLPLCICSIAIDLNNMIYLVFGFLATMHEGWPSCNPCSLVWL